MRLLVFFCEPVSEFTSLQPQLQNPPLEVKTFRHKLGLLLLLLVLLLYYMPTTAASFGTGAVFPCCHCLSRLFSTIQYWCTIILFKTAALLPKKKTRTAWKVWSGHYLQLSSRQNSFCYSQAVANFFLQAWGLGLFPKRNVT